MRTSPFAALTILTCLTLAACTQTVGNEVDQEQLGYQECEKYYDCGTGRYCSAEGQCWSDCRTTADCALLDKGPLCNLFGECVEVGGDQDCTSHADCGENGYCNGRCTGSDGRQDGAVCGSDDDCPCILGVCEACQGTCGPACATDNDCIGFESDDLECTPVGQCLLPGWEQWIPPGELPPTDCTTDGHCVGLGWNWACDCPKEIDPRTGWEVCAGGQSSVCTLLDDPIDFGDGPADSPAHAFTGVWGMRMEIAVVTLGLPLVTKQNTYSSNLFLVKISHREGDTLELEEKICDIKLINFIDADTEFDDLAWMVIPSRYLNSLPVLTQTVELPSANPGDAFTTTRVTEVRGLILDDPVNDPLPDRHVFDADPDDPRFWDQDGDGNVGMTTLMDGVLRGKIYNVQRWSAVYNGRILDADHIKGLSNHTNEQLVISASTPGLIYDTETEIHEQEDRTFHRFQRMADDASCADLIRMATRDDAWLKHTNHLDDVPDP